MTRLLPFALLLAGCTPPAPSGPTPSPASSSSPSATAAASETGRVGVLVMAHGGSEAWNEAVAAAVSALPPEIPAVIAYGMADPTSLEDGLDSLRSLGVDRVAVVRVFVSGESFLEQTEYLLGMRSQRPTHLMLMGRDPSTVGPILHGMAVATHPDGLMGSAQAERILVHRALERSRERAAESVLLIAHGMGDDAANRRVLGAMDRVAELLEASGFARAAAAALREDWAEKRARAEADIRAFVSGETTAGRRVIVVPMRLSGFGPYAEVLDGLEYVPADGLLPHPEVTSWIRDRAEQVICAEGWRVVGVHCRGMVVNPGASLR